MKNKPIANIDNPFTVSHTFDQVQRWKAGGLEQELRHGNTSIEWITPQGRLDDFLNVNMRILDFKVPAMINEDGLWMSLTPMEIQSAHVAIKRAKGRVATAGLGLGYFAVEAAWKDEVSEVVVYEINQDVIELFYLRVIGNPKLEAAFKKMKIIHGDVREMMVDESFDFVFMDPYLKILEDRMIDDAVNFRHQNEITEYHPWGLELAGWINVLNELTPLSNFNSEELQLLQALFITPVYEGSNTMLSEMKTPVDPDHNADFAFDLWDACGRT